MTHSSDTELVHQSRLGSTDAYAKIVERHQAAICATAFAVVRDASLSEDVGQEAFVEGWRKLEQLREPAKVGSWLCSIARTEGLKTLRKRKPAVSLDEQQLTSEQNIEDLFEKRETAALVSSILEMVPEASRTALILFYREEQSIKEVARSLGIGEDAAKQRISRGRQHMREQVERVIGLELKATRPSAAFALGVMADVRSLPMAAGSEPVSDRLADSATDQAGGIDTNPIEAGSEIASKTPRWTGPGSVGWTGKAALAASGIALLATLLWVFLPNSDLRAGFAVNQQHNANGENTPASALASKFDGARGRSTASLNATAAHNAPTETDEDRTSSTTPDFRGRVVDSVNGAPCMHTLVTLLPSGAPALVPAGHALTDEEGAFRFINPPAGEYEVVMECREKRKGSKSRVARRHEVVTLPLADKMNSAVLVPNDWIPLSDEKLEDAPPDIEAFVQMDQNGEVVSPELIEKRAQALMDANQDGTVSDEERRVHEEIASGIVEQSAQHADKQAIGWSTVDYRDKATLDVPTRGHLREGPADAPITIINITDVSCRWCLKAHSILEQLRDDFPGKIQVVTRLNPSIPEAVAGARAFCASREQEAGPGFLALVWEEANIGRDFSEKNMLRIASLLSLDEDLFRSDMNSAKCKSAVEENKSELRELGFSSTPTWIINGEVINGAASIDHYHRIIESKLAEAE